MATDTVPPSEKPVLRRQLSDVSLSDLLLYGLTKDQDDPVLDVFDGVRGELQILTDLIECGNPKAEFDLANLGTVLEGFERRLAVGIELMARARARAPLPETGEASG